MKHIIEMSPKALVELNDLLRISAEAFTQIAGADTVGLFDAEKRILHARMILGLECMKSLDPVGPAIIPQPISQPNQKLDLEADLKDTGREQARHSKIDLVYHTFGHATPAPNPKSALRTPQ